MSKILILSASPHRDEVVDNLIKEELESLGNKVWVHPCLREGREAILKHKPDVVVLPPIRNPYSRDLAETCKDWGIGVVSRHTEASCDWEDFKGGDEAMKTGILGRWRYDIDKELVWGTDEAQILNRRGAGFPAIAVGAFGVDIYKQQGFRDKFLSRTDFCKKWGFDEDKKILTISSPWGFCDSAPDLSIDDMVEVQREVDGRQKYLAMVSGLKQALDCNILVTLHPGVLVEPYKQALGQMKIPLDTESTATDILVNTDVLVHSGSTMGMEMHCMNKPAFQYLDVNERYTCGWWIKSGSALSRISPKIEDLNELAKAISLAGKSNADKKAIRDLEKGRYGKMDGNAYKRAAKEIDEVDGKFKFRWPRAHVDYDQIGTFKESTKAMKEGYCGICKRKFSVIEPKYLSDLCNAIGGNKEKLAAVMKQTFCPWCAARFFRK